MEKNYIITVTLKDEKLNKEISVSSSYEDITTIKSLHNAYVIEDMTDALINEYENLNNNT